MKLKKDDKGRFAKKEFWDYETAHNFVLGLKLKNFAEWQDKIKSGAVPDQVPRRPDREYKGKGWVSLTEFLYPTRKINFLSYEEASKLVQEQNLKSTRQYLKFKADKPYLPFKPMFKYQNEGWVDWKTFLEKKEVVKSHLPRKLKSKLKTYQEARAYLKDLKIKDEYDWFKHIRLGKIPNDIPTFPSSFYRSKDWSSWNDFLSFKPFK